MHFCKAAAKNFPRRKKLIFLFIVYPWSPDDMWAEKGDIISKLIISF